jgi:hypothetical protein
MTNTQQDTQQDSLKEKQPKISRFRYHLNRWTRSNLDERLAFFWIHNVPTDPDLKEKDKYLMELVHAPYEDLNFEIKRWFQKQPTTAWAKLDQVFLKNARRILNAYNKQRRKEHYIMHTEDKLSELELVSLPLT